MNTVAFREDIRLHTRIPLVRAMPEMDAAFKQGFHGNNCHLVLLDFTTLRCTELLALSGVSLAGMDNPLKDAFARPRQDMLL
jgi:hypothetical protein